MKSVNDIGLDEVFWIVNVVVDMGFGGKIDYCVWLVFSQQFGYQIFIVDVVMDENVVWVVF